MIVQFNTDKNIIGKESLEAFVSNTITDDLARFNDLITRVEVHLSDENASKEGPNDKKCILEARVKNKQPIAVTAHANTIEKAVSTAIDKLKAALDTIDGKLKNH